MQINVKKLQKKQKQLVDLFLVVVVVVGLTYSPFGSSLKIKTNGG